MIRPLVTMPRLLSLSQRSVRTRVGHNLTAKSLRLYHLIFFLLCIALALVQEWREELLACEGFGSRQKEQDYLSRDTA